MKTLKLSSIAFAFLCLISSCTKDSSQLSSSTSSSNDQTSLSARETILGKGGKDDQSNQGTQGKDKVVPEMAITFSSDPATKNEDVTVTGKFTDGQGVLACGKLQLKMSTDGITWQDVNQADLSETVQEVSYTFKPSLVGEDVYQFQLHYVSTGGPKCDGYDGGFSGIAYLDVVDPCEGFTLKGYFLNDYSPVPNTDLYEFTVVYEVNTCGLEFDKLKIQGGLTNATEITYHDGPGTYDTWVPGGSKNNIQRWIEASSSGANLPTEIRTYTVKFTKAYSGSGPIELTGEWSVSLTKAGIEVDRKEFPRLNIQ
jgi:hypothetical protein